MNVIEPVDVQKQVRLLPGSQERKDVEVESLEELKRDLEKSTSEERKAKNKAIVITSIIAILGLLLTRNSKISFFKKDAKLLKVLRKISWFLSAGALVKVALSSKDPVLTVVEADGTVSQRSNYGTNNPKQVSRENSEELELKRKSVKATVDILISSGIVKPSQVKNRAKAFNFRKPEGADEQILKELVKYGKQIK